MENYDVLIIGTGMGGLICADLLARGFNLCFLDIVITSYTGVAPDATLCTTTTQTYIDSLNPGEPFVMSDLLSGLYSAGVKTIQTPVTIAYNKYWKDLFPNTTGIIADFMDPADPLNIFMINTVATGVGVI